MEKLPIFEGMNKLLPLLLLLASLLISSCQQTEGCMTGDCKNGFGTFLELNHTFHDGRKWDCTDTYIGEFKNSKRHGQGTFTRSWADFKAQGSKSFDKANGFCVPQDYIGLYTRKIEQSGLWINGKFNGYGTKDLGYNRGTYVGEFKNGKRHGEGTITYNVTEDPQRKNQFETESGNWKDDRLHGSGTRIWAQKPNTFYQSKYIGHFTDGKIDGYGTKWYNWGDYFKGNFDCCSGPKPSQEGTMYHIDGSSEYGSWETVTTYR